MVSSKNSKPSKLSYEFCPASALNGEPLISLWERIASIQDPTPTEPSDALYWYNLRDEMPPELLASYEDFLRVVVQVHAGTKEPEPQVTASIDVLPFFRWYIALYEWLEENYVDVDPSKLPRPVVYNFDPNNTDTTGNTLALQPITKPDRQTLNWFKLESDNLFRGIGFGTCLRAVRSRMVEILSRLSLNEQLAPLRLAYAESVKDHCSYAFKCMTAGTPSIPADSLVEFSHLVVREAAEAGQQAMVLDVNMGRRSRLTEELTKPMWSTSPRLIQAYPGRFGAFVPKHILEGAMTLWCLDMFSVDMRPNENYLCETRLRAIGMLATHHPHLYPMFLAVLASIHDHATGTTGKHNLPVTLTTQNPWLVTGTMGQLTPTRCAILPRMVLPCDVTEAARLVDYYPTVFSTDWDRVNFSQRTFSRDTLEAREALTARARAISQTTDTTPTQATASAPAQPAQPAPPQAVVRTTLSWLLSDINMTGRGTKKLCLADMDAVLETTLTVKPSADTTSTTSSVKIDTDFNVSFYPSVSAWVRGRRTTMRLGRFLARYTNWDDATVKSMVTTIQTHASPPDLVWMANTWANREAWVWCYADNRSVRSCMTPDKDSRMWDSQWSWDDLPASTRSIVAYCYPDDEDADSEDVGSGLALVVLYKRNPDTAPATKPESEPVMGTQYGREVIIANAPVPTDDERVVARAIVHLGRKQYVRVYGDDALGKFLEREGFEHNMAALVGEDIYIPTGTINRQEAYRLPYVDGAWSVEPYGTALSPEGKTITLATLRDETYTYTKLKENEDDRDEDGSLPCRHNVLYTTRATRGYLYTDNELTMDDYEGD